MEYKNTSFTTTFGTARTIIGIASHVGDPSDLDGDVIAPGSFDQSILAVKNGKKIKLLDGHTATGATTVGIVTKLWMDGDKLMFEAKISESTSGEDIYTKLKEGILDQVSIGFSFGKQEFRKDGVRIIKEVELREISIVPIPANPGANILEVKNQSNNTSKEPTEDATATVKSSELYKQYLKHKLNILKNRSNTNE